MINLGGMGIEPMRLAPVDLKATSLTTRTPTRLVAMNPSAAVG
jgi:hypothetical protein